MTGLALSLIVVLGLVIVGVVVAIQRTNKKGDGGGADTVPYLVLALSMGVAGFALAELAATAFPGESVFDPAESLANSLSALVVSTPFAIYFWRRQAKRRISHPGSPGWSLYLSVIELFFMTAFVVAAAASLNELLTDEPASAWTRALVYGAIVVLHELAAQRTPPISDAGELRRVIGSAVSLVVAIVGLTGMLAAAFSNVYENLTGVGALDPGFDPWLAMLVVGLPIWWYRWLRPWDAPPAVPRLTWTVIAVVSALATGIGAATGILVQIVEYLATETGPAAQHFEPLPLTSALVLVAIPTWAIHRRSLADVGGNPLRAYQYALAALGLATSVSMAIALTITTFDRSLIADASARDIITLTIVLLVGLVVWLVFERRAAVAVEDIGSWPRYLYTLGVGSIFGLVAAGALITTLFIIFRRLLDSTQDGSVLQSTTVLVYSGLAAWYLLSAYFRSRAIVKVEGEVAPFDVTVICSHPGMIATRFPEQARLRVVHRGDDLGVVDDEMAAEIVTAVANRTSLVWVDEDGFRIAPMRPSS